MISAGEFRNGVTFEDNGQLFQVIEFQHVKPGKGPAFSRTKLRSLKSGKVLTHTFTNGSKFTIARVERRRFQYLYKDDMGYYFMDSENFEQTIIPEEIISAPLFLKEGLEVEILFHKETDSPLSCDMPAYVELEIVYTEPGE